MSGYDCRCAHPEVDREEDEARGLTTAPIADSDDYVVCVPKSMAL